MIRLPTPQAQEAASWPLLALATTSAFAGAGHLTLVAEHLREYVPLGLAFAAIGVAQVMLAAALIWRPRRVVLLQTLAVYALSIGAWAISRTSGFPFGPEAARPEAIGFVDVAVKIVELVGVVLIVRLLSYGALGAWRGHAIPLLTAALLGGNAIAGHHPASAHVLETLVLAVAGALFGVAVARRTKMSAGVDGRTVRS